MMRRDEGCPACQRLTAGGCGLHDSVDKSAVVAGEMMAEADAAEVKWPRGSILTNKRLRYYAGRLLSDQPVDPQPILRSGSNQIEGAPFLMPPLLIGVGPATCLWQLEDEDADSYRTACGHLWEFPVGGPEANGARFCPYCGRALTVG